MIILIMIVVLVWIINKRHNDHLDRIRELETKLNEYYIERGNRLNNNIKRIESKTNQLRNNGVHSV